MTIIFYIYSFLRFNNTFVFLYSRDSFTEYNICDTETTPAPIKYSAVGTRFIPPPPPLGINHSFSLYLDNYPYSFSS